MSTIPANSNIAKDVLDITPDMIEAINQNDPKIQLEAVQKIRKLVNEDLDVSEDVEKLAEVLDGLDLAIRTGEKFELPPSFEDKLQSFMKVFGNQFDKVIKSGTLPRLIQFLSNDAQPLLQYESALIIKSVAGGNPEQIRVVIDAGAVPMFIKFLASANEDLVELSLIALFSIAKGSTQSRDVLLNQNILSPLLGLFDNLKQWNIFRATSILEELCNPPTNYEKIAPCVPVLSRLITNEDVYVLLHVCRTLCALCAGPKEHIQTIIDSGISPRIVELMSHTSKDVEQAALTFVYNIVMGHASQIPVLLKANVLPPLLRLISHEKDLIVKMALLALGNIIAENTEQVQAIIDANMVPFSALIQHLSHRELEVRKGAMMIIFTTTCYKGGREEKVVVSFIKANVIPPLCNLLGQIDPIFIGMALNVITLILRVGYAKSRKMNANAIEQCGGLDKIVSLQAHENRDIFNKAHHIIDNYFPKKSHKNL